MVSWVKGEQTSNPIYPQNPKPGVAMFEYLEVHKVDPSFKWIEFRAADNDHAEPAVVRLVADEDHKKMAKTFVTRYQARRQSEFVLPDAQLHMIEEICEEAAMARVLCLQGKASPDLLELLPTTVIHFRYPEKTSFRKSRSARVKMFSDEALDALNDRDFERVIHRLDWVHLLDAAHEPAFQWKVVCLRSWKKMAECIPVFEAWIAAHPNSIEPRLGLSEMWLYLGQNNRAIENFNGILEMDANNTMALIGIAQAQIRLGEDPTPLLRKAWMLDPNYTVEMIEHQIDFRSASTNDLKPGTLKSVAADYHIPLARVLERAERGVLPMHAPDESGLPLFSKTELDRHYAVLKCVGLEIQTRELKAEAAAAEPIQPSLFTEEDL